MLPISAKREDRGKKLISSNCWTHIRSAQTNPINWCPVSGGDTRPFIKLNLRTSKKKPAHAGQIPLNVQDWTKWPNTWPENNKYFSELPARGLSRAEAVDSLGTRRRLDQIKRSIESAQSTRAERDQTPRRMARLETPARGLNWGGRMPVRAQQEKMKPTFH